MLACIQRRQNLSSQRLPCTPKSLDVPPPPLLLQVPPLQPCTRKGKPAPMISRYPSPAELDAFAQKTANSPLSIKIFPSDVRVPQHKQLNKTVNGLDTTGPRYSPYSHPYSGGYQGLLAVVKASVVVRGVVKSSEGRRTKHANAQGPYSNNNPLSNGYSARHGHKAYHVGARKLPDVPIETLCSGAGRAPGDQSLAPPRPELADVQSLMRQMGRAPPPPPARSQAPQQLGGGGGGGGGGEARASPSLQAVAAVAVAHSSDSDFAPGAVLPTQSAHDMAKAGYLEKGGEYAAAWQHKHQMQQQQQQQYQQVAVRMYGGGGGGAQGRRAAEAGVGQSPETCLPPYGAPPPPQPGQERAGGSSSLTCGAPVQAAEFSVGPYFAAPLWDGVVATPNSDCYASQVLGADAGLSHPHLHPGRHHHHHHQHHHHHPHPQHHQLQLHPPPRPPLHPQAYSADQNLCCGLPGSSLCHAAALSSSLQSLECLISEIHPPCIKERMLGRGYEAMGMPQLLEHHQQAHVQLPVYR